MTQAIEDGANVLIWCFIRFETMSSRQRTLKIISEQNIDNYKTYRKQLSSMGYDSITHLVSFGGWNGPHLPPNYSGSDLYKVFQEFNDPKNHDDVMIDNTDTSNGEIENQYNLKRLWDGIDWDLEGNDNIQSTRNEFTIELLNQMGTFSIEAKKDGLITSMAPPESYLDTTTSRFSRFVNKTYPTDNWHQDFEYHGWNVYAYVMAKYGEAIDFVMIQFYESYSHALYQTEKMNMSQSDFLVKYIQHLSDNGFGYTVNFQDDQTLDLHNQFVPLPLEKIVFGFANGWAVGSEKAIFFVPSQVKVAFDQLRKMNLEPRGCGYWVVEEEGKNEVELTKELNAIINGIGNGSRHTSASIE